MKPLNDLPSSEGMASWEKERTGVMEDVFAGTDIVIECLERKASASEADGAEVWGVGFGEEAFEGPVEVEGVGREAAAASSSSRLRFFFFSFLDSEVEGSAVGVAPSASCLRFFFFFSPSVDVAI